MKRDILEKIAVSKMRMGQAGRRAENISKRRYEATNKISRVRADLASNKMDVSKPGPLQPKVKIPAHLDKQTVIERLNNAMVRNNNLGRRKESQTEVFRKGTTKGSYPATSTPAGESVPISQYKKFIPN